MIIIIPGNSNMGVDLGSVRSEAAMVFLLFFRERIKRLQSDGYSTRSDLWLCLFCVTMLS